MRAKKSEAFSIYQLLLKNKLIHLHETLFFEYLAKNNKTYRFEAKVTTKGLLVGTAYLNPSFAAIQYLLTIGDARPINGWVVWHNKEGKSLSDLYKQALNISQSHSNLTKKTAFFNRNVYHEYPMIRDTVFFLGAGASIADGAPLQKNIIPLLFNFRNDHYEKSNLYKIVTDFIKTYFICDLNKDSFPNLEQIFGFIEYFIMRGESLSGLYTLEHIVYLRESLIKLIYYIIGASARKKSIVLKEFWKQIYMFQQNISIITVNYDTLAEDAFPVLYPLNCYLDYCYPLANYNFEYLHPSDWWVNPQKPILSTSANYPLRIKYIKLHGSLNWKYCNCCNQLILRAWEKENEFASSPSTTDLLEETNTNFCSLDGNELKSLIIPPSYNKNLMHPIISQMLNEASSEIRLAKKIVFIGYSLPESDVHIKAVLSKSDIAKKEIIVINPIKNLELQRRFLELSSNCKFITKPFNQIINDGDLKQLLGVA
ncbi:SIR2 family protein [Legionella gresilensis]|uniref:SIR2 family protein n=1 Tax=Legionella gresilensis TaxID=91823 RepID=UPI0013EFB7BF|nr:SIR2 family protein [Legionella gresilensis]